MSGNHIHLPQKQRGSTLLEIIVSVFVLGFGLLALVSMQLRSVMMAREAENQTIIAQATDSLIESMTMNPNITNKQEAGVDLNLRDFESYTKNFDTISQSKANCNQDAVLATNKAADLNSGLNKQEIADAHICGFVKRVNQIPNIQNLTMAICPNETIQASTGAPTLNAQNKIACGNGGNITVVKVIWTQEMDDDDFANNAAGTGLKMLNGNVIYTYQSVLGQ